MKILQLCNKVPYPEKDGGVIAINTLTQALTRSGCKVKMLAMNTSKHYVDTHSIPEAFRNETHMETVNVDTDIKALHAFGSLITGKSYNISRFYSKEYKTKLEALLTSEKFDIIQLEGLYLTPYIPFIKALTKAPIVLRAHNTEWIIWQMLANKEKPGLKKWYLSHLTKQLKEYEGVAINLCDGITVFTQTDKDNFIKMGCKVPVEVIPFGINLANYRPLSHNNSNTLFYLGALDWMPNIQGLDWFLNNVWTKVHSAFPELKFHVGGRNMPDRYKNSTYPGVTFHGEVENAKEFIGAYTIMVVPLFAGSGIRIKIIEGMALQKPIITTSVGIEGIDCKNGQDILLADKTDEFYNAIKKLIDNPALEEQIAINGRTYVETRHDIGNITNNLLQFYQSLIGNGPAIS